MVARSTPQKTSARPFAHWLAMLMVALHKDDIMKKLGFALAALLLANSGYAQTPMPSAEKSFTPSTQEELVLDTSSKRAHVEVWFSGGQKERFVFEEGTL